MVEQFTLHLHDGAMAANSHRQRVVFRIQYTITVWSLSKKSS